MSPRPAASGGDRARTLALRLPGASEQDHHGFPSFRVGGKIFATLPNDSLLRVFVDEHSARAAVAANPACSLVPWGKKISGVAFDLSQAPDELVSDYLTEAWESRAPATLREQRRAD